MRISFFANKQYVPCSTPIWESKVYPGKYTRRNAKTSFELRCLSRLCTVEYFTQNDYTFNLVEESIDKKRRRNLVQLDFMETRGGADSVNHGLYAREYRTEAGIFQKSNPLAFGG